ncbi:MAG: Flp family type IVb pilin [Candidatus Wallbacteria bacterium]|nr:Flp family type IVb pilin [Candidatus Wallbacteria bacterium]
MQFFRNRFSRRGQGQSEYTLVLGLIAVVLVGVLYYFGTKTSESLSGSADKVGSSGGTATTTGAGGF